MLHTKEFYERILFIDFLAQVPVTFWLLGLTGRHSTKSGSSLCTGSCTHEMHVSDLEG